MILSMEGRLPYISAMTILSVAVLSDCLSNLLFLFLSFSINSGIQFLTLFPCSCFYFFLFPIPDVILLFPFLFSSLLVVRYGEFSSGGSGRGPCTILCIDLHGQC